MMLTGPLRFFAEAVRAKTETEGELSDDDAEAVSGGIQAGNVRRVIITEFILPKKPAPTTTEHDERLKRAL